METSHDFSVRNGLTSTIDCPYIATVGYYTSLEKEYIKSSRSYYRQTYTNNYMQNMCIFCIYKYMSVYVQTYIYHDRFICTIQPYSYMMYTDVFPRCRRVALLRHQDGIVIVGTCTPPVPGPRRRRGRFLHFTGCYTGLTCRIYIVMLLLNHLLTCKTSCFFIYAFIS